VVAALGAVGGYALGTLQILIVDWARKRREHRSQLRLIRAELRRLKGINSKFGWQTNGPGANTIPRHPDLTTTFLQTVATTDFYITDEHDDDNTQQGLLELTGACTSLEYHWEKALEKNEESAAENNGDRRLVLWIEAKDLADSYDELMGRFQILVSSALSDSDRRLREASFWRQANRPIGRLPQGKNPPALPPPSFSPKGWSDSARPSEQSARGGFRRKETVILTVQLN